MTHPLLPDTGAELPVQLILEDLGAETLEGSGFETEPGAIDSEQEPGDDRDH